MAQDCTSVLYDVINCWDPNHPPMPLGTPQSTPLILFPPLPLLTRPSPPLPLPPESTARQRGISGYSTQTGVAPSWAQMHYRDLQLHRGDNPAPPSHPLTLSERLPCYLLSVAQILPIFSSANSRLKIVLSEIDIEIKERVACQIEKKLCSRNSPSRWRWTDTNCWLHSFCWW